MLSNFFKRHNSLTFTGQFFSENIEILINNNYKNYKNYYFTFNIFEKKSKNNNFSVLNPLNPKHVYKLVNSKIVLSTHGIYFGKLLKKLFNLYFINIGHGPKTIAYSLDELIKNYKYFDEIWFYSNFEKLIWENELKFKNNFFVSGNPKLDYFAKYTQTNFKNKKNYILVAFASFERFQKNEEIKSDIFNLNNFEFLSFLECVGTKLQCKIVIQKHPKFKFTDNAFKFIKNSKNIIFATNLNKNSQFELMTDSSLLLTDWSGFCVEYLLTSKNIVYVNRNKPSNFTFTKLIDNKFTPRVKNYEELFKSLEYSLNNVDSNIEKLRNIIYENKYEYGNKKRSVNRILQKLT